MIEEDRGNLSLLILEDDSGTHFVCVCVCE